MRHSNIAAPPATRWISALTVLAFGLAALGANAAPPTLLHSNPGADDNVRLYIALDSAASLAIDAAAPSPLEVQAVMFTQLSAGPHHAQVTLPDGTSASLDFNLAIEDQIESKGRRWWCLSTGRRNGQLIVLQFDRARCKAFAEVGPD